MEELKTNITKEPPIPENTENAENTESSESTENSISNSELSTPEENQNNSGVQISANVNEEEALLFIGDRIGINSLKNGKIIGHIYFLNDNMMRIMPDGTTNILIDFPIVNGEFDPDLGILTDSSGDLDITRYEKGPRVGFIKLHSFRVDQVLNAITADGKQVGKYTITDINENDDKMIIENKETNEIINLNFAFQGIPLEEPFGILRIAPEETKPEEVPAEPEVVAEDKEEENDDFEEFELPDIAQVETIQAEERIYPEISQKSDFKEDLLSFLDAASRKNPLTIRRIRTLVEMFSSLKNSIIKRDTAGFVQGEEKISLSTMNDILLGRNVPIIRPVLEAKRVIVSERFGEAEIDSEQTTVRQLEKIITLSEEHLRLQGGIPPNEEYPRWFQALNSYFRKFPLGIEYSSNGYSFDKDSEYFRSGMPVIAVDNKEIKTQISGLTKLGDEDTYDPQDYITDIKQSLNRGHGPTVRGLVKGGTEIVIPADQAPVIGYLLFPYRAVLSGYLGAIRTGVLWESILRSSSDFTINNEKYKSIWMEKILENLGGVSEIKDAQNILYLESGSINVSFSIYLKMILDTIIVRGPGDLTSLKSDLGISDMELTVEQDNLIRARIEEVIASLRTMIRIMRSSTTKITIALNPILENSMIVKNINDIASQNTELFILLKQFTERTPGYKDIDVATFGYIYSKAQDYLIACLSKNTKAIESEHIKYKRTQLQQILMNAYKERDLESKKGAPPEPNPCVHTNNLTIIRKIKEPTERVALLSKFLMKFKGAREENWINCNVCDKHLICHHELLQIKQFNRPREHAAIQKEIVLGYAGGTFGRHYICRNCGLPIADMEYDTSIEYDDSGKPMSGSSELVDEDAIEKEELELMFGPQVEKQREIEFETPLKTEIYRISRIICDRIGVSLSDISYRQIVDRGDSILRQTIVSEAIYKEKQKEIKTYKKYVTRSKIALSAALVLISVQTHIPDYVIIPMEGCKAGIGGYPLIPDAKPDIQEQSTGIHYIVCALLDFFPQFTGPLAEIWSNGFQTIVKKTDREKNITQYIIQALKYILEKDSKVHTELDKKRRYLEDIYGSGATTVRVSESITPGFLPRMEGVLNATENAANEPSIAEGIKKGNAYLADTWIRAVNRVIESNTTVVKGNPYAVVSCCPSPITEPGSFWKSLSLPNVPENIYVPRGFLRQSTLYTSFIPRDLIQSMAEPSLDLAYRVFLQVCWQGPRTGYAHELGYDNKCDWCGLEIPTEYLYPDIPLSNPSWGSKKIADEEEKEELKQQQLIENIKLSFTNQGIAFTQESLQAILDNSHNHTIFKTYYSPAPINSEKLLNNIGSIEEAPVVNWNKILNETIIAVKSLGSSDDRIAIAGALQGLREGIMEAELLVKERMEEILYNLLKKILKESPEAILEIIRSYLLIPIQRIYSKYERDMNLDLPSQYKKGTSDKLSDDHIKELTTIINNHTNYLVVYNDSIIQTSDLGQIKLGYYVEQVSALMNFSSELRISRMQFDNKLTQVQMEMFLTEILRVILFGPLADLLNPDFTPALEEEYDLSSEKDALHSEIRKFIRDLLIQYDRERLSYNPAEVREKIAEAKEVEKQGFIRKFDVLDDEDRQIELIKKRLKIGRWAQGNGKLAYSYDPDNWDRMRTERDSNYEFQGQIMGPEEGVDGEGYDGQDDQQKEEGEE